MRNKKTRIAYIAELLPKIENPHPDAKLSGRDGRIEIPINGAVMYQLVTDVDQFQEFGAPNLAVNILYKGGDRPALADLISKVPIINENGERCIEIKRRNRFKIQLLRPIDELDLSDIEQKTNLFNSAIQWHLDALSRLSKFYQRHNK